MGHETSGFLDELIVGLCAVLALMSSSAVDVLHAHDLLDNICVP